MSIPSIYDVALLAGVSHQTVSRVINQPHRVRADNRNRVLAAIEELGYRPNSIARALASRRSGMVGVVVGDGDLWVPPNILRALRDVAKTSDLFLAASTIGGCDDGEFNDAVNTLLDRGVDALIVVAVSADTALVSRLCEARGVPLLAVDGRKCDAIRQVGTGQAEGVALATKHLIGLGHAGIRHVAGPASCTDASVRRQGYESAMRAAGLTPLPSIEADWSAASGFASVDQLLASTGTSAVVCASDSIAIGVLSGLRRRGVSVPADVSVVGFGDIPEAPFLSPELTTVTLNFSQTGAIAFEALRESTIPGAVAPSLATAVVVRGSCGMHAIGQKVDGGCRV